jgi:hypothetical protein
MKSLNVRQGVEQPNLHQKYNQKREEFLQRVQELPDA